MDNVHIALGSTRHVIVAFAGFGMQLQMPPFHFFRLTRTLACTRIFVRDPHCYWYHRGIGDGLDTLEAVADYLGAVLTRMHPERTTFVGTSGGGYGALLFGALCGADRVLAFGGQTTLRLPVRNEERRQEVLGAGLASAAYFDLRAHLPGRAGRVEIHYCAGDDLDQAQARHAIGVPRVELRPHPCPDHEIAPYLRNSGRLATMMA